MKDEDVTTPQRPSATSVPGMNSYNATVQEGWTSASPKPSRIAVETQLEVKNEPYLALHKCLECAIYLNVSMCHITLLLK